MLGILIDLKFAIAGAWFVLIWLRLFCVCIGFGWFTLLLGWLLAFGCWLVVVLLASLCLLFCDSVGVIDRLLCLLWFWFDSLLFMVDMGGFDYVVCLVLIWFSDWLCSLLFDYCMFVLLIVKCLFAADLYRLIVLLSFVSSFESGLVYSLLVCWMLCWLLCFGLLFALVMFGCRLLFVRCLWLFCWFTWFGCVLVLGLLSGLNLVFVWLLRVYLFSIVSCWLLSVVWLFVVCLDLVLVFVVGCLFW